MRVLVALYLHHTYQVLFAMLFLDGRAVLFILAPMYCATGAAQLVIGMIYCGEGGGFSYKIPRFFSFFCYSTTVGNLYRCLVLVESRLRGFEAYLIPLNTVAFNFQLQ